MKRILITGGAGYIGSHTAVALHEAGFTPVILDNLCNSDERALDGIARITGARPIFYHGDCRDAALLRDIFAREEIAGVIHFAAHKAVGESVQKPLQYYDNNINTLLRVLTATGEQLSPHAQTTFPFIFSSSATVYGDADTMPLTEETPRKPATNPYGNTKAIAEDILRDTVIAQQKLLQETTKQSSLPSEEIASSQHHLCDTASDNDAILLHAIALRYFNPIGAHPSGHIGERPGGTPANLVPYLTGAAAGTLPPLTVYGDDYDTPDGTGVRDYIHVVDLAEAHVAALRYALGQADAPRVDTFNIGTGRGTSVKELITQFEEATGVKVPHTIGARRDGDVATCYADTTKAANILGWRARYTIADALRHAWAWEQRQRTES